MKPTYRGIHFLDKKKSLKVLFAGLFLALLFMAIPGFAEEEASSFPSSDPNAALQEKIARWKELREKDPQAFEQKIQERKGQIKSRLQKFQQENPEKFEQFKKQWVQRRHERMQNLRQENPEKFQQVIKNREQRLQQWKEKNPEKYEQFMKNHPKMQERMQNRENRMRERGENFRGQNQKNSMSSPAGFSLNQHGEVRGPMKPSSSPAGFSLNQHGEVRGPMKPSSSPQASTKQSLYENGGDLKNRGPRQNPSGTTKNENIQGEGQPQQNFQGRREGFRNAANSHKGQGLNSGNVAGQRPPINNRPGLGFQEGSRPVRNGGTSQGGGSTPERAKKRRR